MKKSIRIMSMLLMLLMLVTTVSLVSCSNKTDDDETTTTAAGFDDQTTAKPESKYDIGDNIPETLKYGGETIPIVSRSNKWVVDEVTVENNDGGLINSAVVKRNKIVEERLGVKIENTLVDGNNYAISDLIRNQAQTDHLYDIFVNSVYSTIMYTAENLLPISRSSSISTSAVLTGLRASMRQHPSATSSILSPVPHRSRHTALYSLHSSTRICSRRSPRSRVFTIP